MKVIVDIPDAVWNKAKEYGHLDICGIELSERVMNGTPLSEGEWIDHSEDYGYAECPICHELTTCSDNIDELHFCWHCGAKMKGGAE